MRRFAIAIAAVLALGLAPSRAECQGAWWVTPYLSLSGEYDSNVFSTPTGESSDLIGTVSFGLSLAYQSPTLALSASYGTSAEWYRDETQLDNFGDNQNAGLGLNWQIDPRTSVGLTLSYTRTNDSSDFLSPVVLGPPPRTGAPDPSAPATVPAPTIAGPIPPTTPTDLPGATATGVPGVGVGRRLSEVFAVITGVEPGKRTSIAEKPPSAYTTLWATVAPAACSSPMPESNQRPIRLHTTLLAITPP